MTNISCSRIDHFFISQQWFALLPASCLKGFPRPVSDHCPFLLLDIDKPKDGTILFRFENMWIRHNLVKQSVKFWWGKILFLKNPVWALNGNWNTSKIVSRHGIERILEVYHKRKRNSSGVRWERISGTPFEQFKMKELKQSWNSKNVSSDRRLIGAKKSGCIWLWNNDKTPKFSVFMPTVGGQKIRSTLSILMKQFVNP